MVRENRAEYIFFTVPANPFVAFYKTHLLKKNKPLGNELFASKLFLTQGTSAFKKSWNDI